jgi:hypothetical protein
MAHWDELSPDQIEAIAAQVLDTLKRLIQQPA